MDELGAVKSKKTCHKANIRAPLFKLKPFIIAIGIALPFSLYLQSVWSLPQAPQFSPKNISVQTTGNTLHINQVGERAIIKWRTFNIEQNEHVFFHQPNSSSIILNRINKDFGASQIKGFITANGRIILVNPKGIHFTKSAVVNVAGLIATTADIRDQDFYAGNYVFQDNSNDHGSITNEGKIIVQNHGLVALVGSNVTNDGYIQANMGVVVLGASTKYTVDFNGDGMINFQVGGEVNSQDKPLITNTGNITADGGQVMVKAQVASSVLDNVINMQGHVQANSVGVNNGQIILNAGTGSIHINGSLTASGTNKSTHGGHVRVYAKKVQIENSNIDVSGDTGGGDVIVGMIDDTGTIDISPTTKIDASAITSGNGGSVQLNATDQLNVSGKIYSQGGSVNGNGGAITLSGSKTSTVLVPGELNAFSQNGTGGNITILGNDVGLTDHASINASGQLGGGTVLIGGEAHGSGPQNASHVYYGKDVIVNADALLNGNGGTVVVWSDLGTKYYGNIFARGGSESGNGGWVETSGKYYLDVQGNVNTSAQSLLYSGGNWYLDPTDVIITTTQTPKVIQSGGDFTINDLSHTAALINVANITNALNSGTNVTVSTSSSGTDHGDISVEAEILKSAGPDASLTLTAAPVGSAPTGSLIGGTITIDSAATIKSTSNKLDVVLSAGNNIFINTYIITNGGAFSATGTGVTLGPSRAAISGEPAVGQAVRPGLSVSSAPIINTNAGTLYVNAGTGALTLDKISKLLSTGTVNITADAINFTETRTGGTPGAGGTGGAGGTTGTWTPQIGGDGTGTASTDHAAQVNITTTSGTPIGIAGGSGTLLLTPDIIAIIKATDVKIGDANAGAIDVGTNQSPWNLANDVDFATNSLTLQSGSSVKFNGNVDSHAPATQDLIINAGGALQIFADIGSTHSFNSLQLTGDNISEINGTNNFPSIKATTLTVHAKTGITLGINGDVDAQQFNNNTVTNFTASNAESGDIVFNNTGAELNINGISQIESHNISIYNDHTININGYIGNANYEGNILLQINGDNLSNIILNSPIITKGSVTLATTGGVMQQDEASNDAILSSSLLTIRSHTGIRLPQQNTFSKLAISNIGPDSFYGIDLVTNVSQLTVTTSDTIPTISGITEQNTLTTGFSQVSIYNSNPNGGDIVINAPVSNITKVGRSNDPNSGNLDFKTNNGMILINAPITTEISNDTNGLLSLSAGAASIPQLIFTTENGLINVNRFELAVGNMFQVVGLLGFIPTTLPAFSADKAFLIDSAVSGDNSGQFIRALGGDGSSDQPYQITDIYGLQGIGSNTTTLAKSYILMNDIDATITKQWQINPGTDPASWTNIAPVTNPPPGTNNPEGFTPISIGYSSDKFSGSLDGQNNKIKNLYISNPNTSQGLFAFIGTTGAVSNIKFTNLTVKDAGEVFDVGGLVGFNQGTVSNINSSSGTITVGDGSSNIGGIVGVNVGGTVSNILSDTKITVNGVADITGGIVGYNQGTISDVTAFGTLDNQGQNMGGIAGYNSGTITNAATSMNVNGGTRNIGGLVGINAGTITNSQSSGNVTASTGDSNSIGGFVGQNADGAVIAYSSSTGTVNVDQAKNIGGFVGSNVGLISQSYSIGSVVGINSNIIGGFAGFIGGGSGNATIINAYSLSSVDISGSSSTIGGFVGMNVFGVITNTYSAGYVNGHGVATDGYADATSNSLGTFNFSFWDNQTSGQTDSNYLPRTTAQMMQQSTFTTDAPGASWDFTNIWGIVNGQSYPYLKVFYNGTPRAISGYAYAIDDATGISTPVTPETHVNLVVTGNQHDVTTTTNSGFYYFLEGMSTVGANNIDKSINDNAAFLTYLPSSSTVGTSVTVAPSAGGNITNLNIYPNTVRVGSDAIASISNADLANAAGSLPNTVPAILYSVSGNNLTVGNPNNTAVNLNTTDATTYNINGTITPIGSGNYLFGGPTTISADVTSNGNQTYSGAVTLGASSTLNSNAGTITFANKVTGTSPFALSLQTSSAVPGISMDVVNSTSAGPVNFNGDVNVDTINVNSQTTFNANVTLTNLNIAAGQYSVAMHGASNTITSNVIFSNTGGVIFDNNGVFNFNGGLQSNASKTTIFGTVNADNMTLGNVDLIGASTLKSGNLSVLNINNIGSLHDLTIDATDGTGEIELNGDIGSPSNPVNVFRLVSKTIPTVNLGNIYAFDSVLVNTPNAIVTLNSNKSIVIAMARVVDSIVIVGNRVILSPNVTLQPGSVPTPAGEAVPDVDPATAAGEPVPAASVPARFLIYSTYTKAPIANDRGSVSYDFKQYNATYDPFTPVDSTTGNGFLYSIQPLVTPSLVGLVNKEYDGNDSATLNNSGVNNNYAYTVTVNNQPVNLGDAITFNPTSGKYDTKDVKYDATDVVQSNKTVTVTNVTMDVPAKDGTVDVYGYQLASTTATGDVGRITPKPLSATIDDQTKTYGDPDPALNGIAVTLSGKINNDDVSATLKSLTRDSGEDYGAANITRATFNQLTGVDGKNYTLNDSLANIPVLHITRKVLAIDFQFNPSKTYGDPDPALDSIFHLNGIVNATNVYTWNDNGNVNIDGTDVAATNITVQRTPGEDHGSYSFSASFSANNLTGTNAPNYDFPAGAFVGTLDIGQKKLTADLPTNPSKTYGDPDPALDSIPVHLNGIVNATDVYTWYGNVSIDGTDVSATINTIHRDPGEDHGSYSYAGTFNNLGGTKALNYTLNDTTFAGILDIGKKALTATIADQSKVYGDLDPAFNTYKVTLNGIVNINGVYTWNKKVNVDGTNVSATVSSLNRVDGKDVGSYNITTVSYNNLTGDAAGNYTLADSFTNTPVLKITSRPLTIKGIIANNKVYDSTLNATLSNVGTLSGIVLGDDITFDTSKVNAQFDNKNAGNHIVTATGYTLTGNDLRNYKIESLTLTTRASITPATITSSGIRVYDKLYDGTTTAILDFTSAKFQGVYANDIVNYNQTDYNASYNSANLGNNHNVNVSNLQLNGDDAGNYILIQQPTGLTGNIVALTPITTLPLVLPQYVMPTVYLSPGKSSTNGLMITMEERLLNQYLGYNLNKEYSKDHICQQISSFPNISVCGGGLSITNHGFNDALIQFIYENANSQWIQIKPH